MSSERAVEGGSVAGELAAFIAAIPDGHRVTERDFERRHRMILLGILAQLPVLLVISRFEGTGTLTGAAFPEIPITHAIGGVAAVGILAALAAIPALPRRVRSTLASLSFMSVAAVLAYFWGGFIEAHFLYFVGVGVVALYEDWVPFAAAILYVVFQHSLFGMVTGMHVYNHPAAMDHPIAWGVIHGVFVAGLAVAILFHWRSLEATYSDLDDRQDDLDALAEKQAEVEQAREEAEKQREQVATLNETLRLEASELADALSAVADRDLTVEPPRDSDVEAIRQLSDAYRSMTDDLSDVIIQLRTFAADVESTTDSVQARAETLRETQRESAREVRDLSERLRDQATALETAGGEMGQLSATIEEIAASAESVSTEATETADIANDAEDELRDAVTVMDAVEESVGTVVDLAESMDERMDAVEETTAAIEDIADRTNILALNAGIEAARAGGGAVASGSATDGGVDTGAGGSKRAGAGATGDVGAGFAVVAEEVKALADRTQTHAATIGENVDRTLSDVTAVRTDVGELQSSVDDGRQQVDAAGSTFGTVTEAMDRLDDSMGEVADATDDGAASATEVASTIADVADRARALAETGDSVADGAERTADDIAEIATEITELRDGAGTLVAELDRFTLRSAGDEFVFDGPETAGERPS
ncbi:methyl-accepting chemotaxis protein [Halorubrum vacuolatum]|uniref:Methyl-accepting chemotaxis protein n=1 Tax=Halorubrum vacuolatum TaxID=63740 RepID=A0A238VAF6_HALVU|nr:methyl-accepting chemotaxis protein [Halorubrum vacuolatum]SNR31178.1 Methyl-accepting chemotaxis protein [Halorubrum vacuolatum]